MNLLTIPFLLAAAPFAFAGGFRNFDAPGSLPTVSFEAGGADEGGIVNEGDGSWIYTVDYSRGEKDARPFLTMAESVIVFLNKSTGIERGDVVFRKKGLVFRPRHPAPDVRSLNIYSSRDFPKTIGEDEALEIEESGRTEKQLKFTPLTSMIERVDGAKGRGVRRATLAKGSSLSVEIYRIDAKVNIENTVSKSLTLLPLRGAAEFHLGGKSRTLSGEDDALAVLDPNDSVIIKPSSEEPFYLLLITPRARPFGAPARGVSR